jgi:hypothetical protein
MFSKFWKDYSDKVTTKTDSGMFRRYTDDHPEGFTIDPQPLPESVITANHNNIKNMFNRSYIEAATIGAGSIALLSMVVRYTRK